MKRPWLDEQTNTDLWDEYGNWLTMLRILLAEKEILNIMERMLSRAQLYLSRLSGVPYPLALITGHVSLTLRVF